jgi:hypothetical protein
MSKEEGNGVPATSASVVVAGGGVAVVTFSTVP